MYIEGKITQNSFNNEAGHCLQITGPCVVHRALTSTSICITCSPLSRIEVGVANSKGPSPETESERLHRKARLTQQVH